MRRRAGRGGRVCREAPGGAVELVGKVGNDGAGDAVVVALGRLGIGHAALLRDPARPTPVLVPAAADNAGAEVDAEAPESGCCRKTPPRGLASMPRTWNWPCASCPGGRDRPRRHSLRIGDRGGMEGASFSSARLVVVVPAGASPPDVPQGAVVLEALSPTTARFGRLVGVFAGALDAGVDTVAAFEEAVAVSGWSGSSSSLPTRAAERVAVRLTKKCPTPVECRSMDRATDGLSNSGTAALPPGFDPSARGPLDRATAIALMTQADDLLERSEPDHALALYSRVIGTADRDISAAGFYGSGNALYRLDREAERAWPGSERRVWARRRCVPGLASGGRRQSPRGRPSRCGRRLP